METPAALGPDPLRSGEQLCLMSEAVKINMSTFILRGALKSQYHTQGRGKDAEWEGCRLVAYENGGKVSEVS